MPSHGRYGETRGVRWDPELRDFVMKCDDCARKGHRSYWLITLEFWNPRSMQRCRACNMEKKRTDEGARRRSDLAYAKRRREYAKRYYEENKPVVAMKHKIYMRAYRKRQRGDAA